MIILVIGSFEDIFFIYVKYRGLKYYIDGNIIYSCRLNSDNIIF